jgi:hypothetical protein
MEAPLHMQKHAGQKIYQKIRRRYLDVLASVYIYNEHRGYTSLDRVLAAVTARYPDNAAFIAQVQKHRADERKHYIMFKRYFEHRKKMPLSVGSTCGHIDNFIEMIFGCTIDELDTGAIMTDARLFEKLCRVIMLTEQRGMAQLGVLLKSRAVQSDPVLLKIFKIIETDEPSHWQPYAQWLQTNSKTSPTLRERATDFWIHKSLMLLKLPMIFFNLRTPRDTHWADAADTGRTA